ncbi:unnamed protein product, partial [Didymodactylos carnosus]
YEVFDSGNVKYYAEAALIMKIFDGIKDKTRSTGNTNVTITRANG